MTSTVGSGVYYRVPVWCGLTLGPSVLVWPAVATTLDGGERAFASPAGKRQVHQAFDLPPFVNVSAVWEL